MRYSLRSSSGARHVPSLIPRRPSRSRSETSMIRRWIIRGLFLLPLLLWMAGWVWSYSNSIFITCNTSRRTWAVLVDRGQIEFNRFHRQQYDYGLSWPHIGIHFGGQANRDGWSFL